MIPMESDSTRRRPVRAALAATLLGCALASPGGVDAQAAQRPLSKDAVIRLLKGDVAPKRVGEMARERGIDFEMAPAVESELRQAGATDELVATLRELAPKPPMLVIETSPGAQVYLDDTFKGQASPQGRLVIDNAKPGDHTLRVSLAGKKDYEQQITAVAGQVTKVEAALADLAGSIRVQTSAGAEVFLDNSSKGKAGPSGQLVIPDVAGGDHALRVTARGKKEYRQSVTVVAGEESKIDAALAEIEKPPTRPGEIVENPKDGLKYVWIPPGTFMMGCSPGDGECFANGFEPAAHRIVITRGFWLGQTEVTVRAYKRFSVATGHQMPPAPDFNAGWANENMPIVNVTWDDAQAYCTWIGGRLPTEAEWEYAARAGSAEPRYGPLDEIAWHDTNSGGQTHEVAQKRANAWGLFDMLGNVWEWVGDWFDNSYQQSAGSDPTGPPTGQYKVLRGGAWFNEAKFLRFSNRAAYSVTIRNPGWGFRCAREVGSP